MAITNRDRIINGLANASQSLVINKASVASQLAGGFCSLWRATGIPGQGAIPTAVAVCDSTMVGAFRFNDASGLDTDGQAVKTHLARLFLVSGNTGTDVQIHDRLLHMGGLSGIVITPQTVGVDASVTTTNMVLRRGDVNYSDVQWWHEGYVNTGVTAVTATYAVTYDDDSTGNVAVPIPASTAASRLIQIQPAVAGRYIKSIQTVTLSATTGTAGNFGVTCTRSLTSMSLGLANAGEVYDWAMLGLPETANGACVVLIVIPGTTSSGTLYGSGKLISG